MADADVQVEPGFAQSSAMPANTLTQVYRTLTDSLTHPPIHYSLFTSLTHSPEMGQTTRARRSMTGGPWCTAQSPWPQLAALEGSKCRKSASCWRAEAWTAPRPLQPFRPAKRLAHRHPRCLHRLDQGRAVFLPPLPSPCNFHCTPTREYIH